VLRPCGIRSAHTREESTLLLRTLCDFLFSQANITEELQPLTLSISFYRTRDEVPLIVLEPQLAEDVSILPHD
jgi:hypothetical protein